MRLLQQITRAAPEAFYQCVCECELDATGVAECELDSPELPLARQTSTICGTSRKGCRVCVCVNAKRV